MTGPYPRERVETILRSLGGPVTSHDILWKKYLSDPLAAKPVESRFCDGRSYAVLYATSDFETAFVEVVVRDTRSADTSGLRLAKAPASSRISGMRNTCLPGNFQSACFPVWERSKRRAQGQSFEAGVTAIRSDPFASGFNRQCGEPSVFSDMPGGLRLLTDGLEDRPMPFSGPVPGGLARRSRSDRA